jgi:hypothetical protein
MLWSAFMPELMTFAHGCPIPVAESKARQAAIEFFRRTRAWVEWLDPVTSIASASAEYDMEPPSGADVIRIEQATIGGNQVPVASFRDVAQDWERQALSELQLVSRDLKTFRMGGTAAAGLLIQVQAALIPSRTSTGIPDDLFEKYVDDIAHGARAKILSIPGTTFYNPDIFMLEQSAFESSIATKSVDAWRGLTKNTPRSRVNFC